MTIKAPSKGDIVLIDFNPQAGHEQAGKRPAFVVSQFTFNSVTGFALVCPITNQKKGYPFEVEVEGAEATTGVILSDQIKSLDWKARKMRIVDRASDETTENVLGLVNAIING